MYLLWSYLPSPFLHQFGIYYYPDRWWALAVPAFIVMTLVYIYVALALFNIEYLTLPMASIENIVDEAANIAVLDSKGRVKRKGKARNEYEKSSVADTYGSGTRGFDWKCAWSEGTDAVMDVPVGGVCEILYGEGMS
jgi:phosphatidylinositol glycan class P protein